VASGLAGMPTLCRLKVSDLRPIKMSPAPSKLPMKSGPDARRSLKSSLPCPVHSKTPMGVAGPAAASHRRPVGAMAEKPVYDDVAVIFAQGSNPQENVGHEGLHPWLRRADCVAEA